MKIELTADQRELARRAIQDGRIASEEEAVREALSLWEERERRRFEILLMLDEAEASLARGEGREITEESMRALAEDTKRRMRRRLAAERVGVFAIVESDPEILSGTPVFTGTRVPFATLFDYLEAGQPLAEFLKDFPTVSKEHAIAALKQAKQSLLTQI